MTSDQSVMMIFREVHAQEEADVPKVFARDSSGDKRILTFCEHESSLFMQRLPNYLEGYVTSADSQSGTTRVSLITRTGEWTVTLTKEQMEQALAYRDFITTKLRAYATRSKSGTGYICVRRSGDLFEAFTYEPRKQGKKQTRGSKWQKETSRISAYSSARIAALMVCAEYERRRWRQMSCDYTTTGDGETPIGIALKHGIRVRCLIRANSDINDEEGGLQYDTVLPRGMLLNVPGVSSESEEGRQWIMEGGAAPHLGASIEREFDGKFYEGIIVATSPDNRLSHVVYPEDLDEEDLDEDEVREAMVGAAANRKKKNRRSNTEVAEVAAAAARGSSRLDLDHVLHRQTQQAMEASLKEASLQAQERPKKRRHLEEPLLLDMDKLPSVADLESWKKMKTKETTASILEKNKEPDPL